MKNILYYGDNLDILRRYIKDDSIDLIYLDPPFKSNQDYNILFKERNGTKSSAQIKAFEDTWHWGREAEETYREIVESSPKKVADLIRSFRSFLGENDMMAYLVMMAIRLQELHRVLKPRGSIYLHCDPTASHYLKLLMDAVFGGAYFRNEIVWKRTTAHNDPKRFGRINDILLFYSKGDNPTWNVVYGPYDPDYVKTYYRYKDRNGRRFLSDNLTAPAHGSDSGQYEWKGKYPPGGRMWSYTKEKMEELEKEGHIFYTRNGYPRLKRYLDDMPGMPLQSIWTDILNLRSWHRERLGYPTQKPETLLERIIKASSNEGDIVLDPFCGCGTTIVVAEKLRRKWIGIDITHLAISLMRHRLEDSFGEEVEYEVIGEPVDLKGAEELAKQDPYQFQWWALGLVGARPAESEKKKGADKGIDGYIYFHDEPKKGKTKAIILQVKSGHVNRGMIDALKGVVEREEAQIGVFITLTDPTRGMKEEALKTGFYKSPWGQHPRIQILTIKELLAGKKIDYPPRRQTDVTFKKAERKSKGKPVEQKEMF